MKNLRQLTVAVAFTFALVMPALAGEIQTTVTSPHPAHAATTQGQIDTTVTKQAEETTAATDSVAQAALNLLQSVLSLF